MALTGLFAAKFARHKLLEIQAPHAGVHLLEHLAPALRVWGLNFEQPLSSGLGANTPVKATDSGLGLRNSQYKGQLTHL